MSLVITACLLVPVSTLANAQASATAIPFSFIAVQIREAPSNLIFTSF